MSTMGDIGRQLFGIVLGGACVLVASCATAQITPDRTLPNNSNVMINGSVFNITGGTQAGRNLFHSFQQFSVPTGGTAFFNNATDIQSIFSRVTGGEVSNIDGLVRANGTANLFLINPNGIIFGQNASLNVGGSFVGTTANAIQFGNLGFFSATNPEAPSPLLTINPSALLFNQLSPASITSSSTAPAGFNPAGVPITGLRVPDGQSLLLVGGDVNVNGGSLRAYQGRVELAGLAASGTVGLNLADNTLSLNVPVGVARANVFLTNGAEVNVRGANGGSIVINAHNLNLAGASILRAGIASELGTPNSQAGDIEINATGDTTLSDGSFIANAVQSQATGKGGNTNITTGSLSLTNGASLSNSTFGQGDAGRVFVQASKAVSLVNSSILNDVEAGAVGNTNGIFITAESLSLTNGAYLESSIFGANASALGGRGNPGGVNINVSDRVTFAGVNQNGATGIYNNTYPGSVGKAGDIRITTGSLSLTNGAVLFSNTSGNGDAGNITIDARDTVSFDGGTVANVLKLDAVGKAGDIRITTGTLSLTDTASLFSDTFGKGDAGNITIDARDTVSFDGDSLATSRVLPNAVGKGGNIHLTTGTLSLKNGSQLTSNVFGQGDVGNISIDARDTINFDSGASNKITGVESSIFGSGMGKAGDIQLTTGSLSLTNSSLLFASNSGRGNAGNITINASDTITFDGTIIGLGTEVGPLGIGNSGDISVNARALFLKNGSQLIVSNLGQGNAGNITINARDAVSFDGSSRIVSSIVGSGSVGNGGDIRINTGSLSVTNGASLFIGTFGRGDAGSVNINARDAVSFDGTTSNGNPSGVFSTVEPGSVGNAGNINIQAGSLSLANNAQISASELGIGNLGNINIKTEDTISLNGGSTVSSTLGAGTARRLSIRFNNQNIPIITLEPLQETVYPNAQGKSGNINISTNSLTVTDGARLATSTFGQGNAGNIDIRTTNTRFSGSDTTPGGVFSDVQSGAVGNGGNIKISTEALTINSGAQLVASTFGKGDAGSINITARDTVSFNGVGKDGSPSGASSAVETGAVGDGGNLTVDAKRLNILNGAVGDVSNLGGGNHNAGNLQLKADFINLDFGKLIANSTSGQGGNVFLQVKDILLMRHNSLISNTSGTAQTGGNGGDFTLNAPNGFIVAVPNENSDIFTNAFIGKGGKINIAVLESFGFVVRTQEDLVRLLGTNDPSKLNPQQLPTNDIAAISQISPNVVNATEKVSQELVPLSTNFINPNTLIANSCIARSRKQQGTFNITGPGGLPNRPLDASISSYPTGTVRNVQGNNISYPWHKGDPIMEPQAIYKLPNGHLVLSRECS